MSRMTLVLVATLIIFAYTGGATNTNQSLNSTDSFQSSQTQSIHVKSVDYILGGLGVIIAFQITILVIVIRCRKSRTFRLKSKEN